MKSSENDGKNDSHGIEILLGDPKRAILKLSLPMIVAMSVQTLYNLVDAVWVAGLGADALAAIGFAFPFFFAAMALSNGLGIGGGSAISRRIGSQDKEGADNVAVHTIVMMLLIAALFTIPLFFCAEGLFVMIGAGRTVDLAVAYAQVIFAGSIFLFFTNTANAILRAEGDSRRAMYVMVLGAGMNIVLDPIFIYTLKMGIAGAAWATIISLAVSSSLMLYWMSFKKDMYVSFKFRGFRLDKSIVQDIFGVGVPAAVMQLAMTFTILIMNTIIVMVGNTDGVAVYTTGWRVVSIAILPLVGIATAVVSVTGVAFGKHSFEKAKIAHRYAIKIGFMIEVVIAAATFIFAPQIAAVFTYTEEAVHIAPDLITFLRVVSLSYVTVPFGMLSSSLFQGTGNGMNALIVTVLRTIVLTPLFSFLLAFNLCMGLNGIWWGLVAANTIGSAVAFAWAGLYTRRLINLAAPRPRTPPPSNPL
ncbi:MAG: MATE family efflux transporter [Euryarchaeota archaeon]|nr:MAG: Multidrug resistance protein MdtK [ANME-2 cluster archaeon]MEA1864030.1 MATE family efflux transporter [Euryarchaeota archaeon]